MVTATAAAPGPSRRGRRAMPRRSIAALVLVLCVCLGLCTAWKRPLSPGFNDPAPYFTRPLLEIVHPQNDMMLAHTELQIEIEVRGNLINGGLQRSLVCITMQPAYVPRDVQLKNSSLEVDESCFDEGDDLTSFHVAGLVPGLSYSVTVGLQSGGNIVAISTRTFWVGSVLLSGMEGRMSIASALEAGAKLHNAQDRDSAKEIYKYILSMFPDHPRAQHLLGLALYQDGKLHEALPYLLRAVEVNDAEENFHNSLAICLKALGRVDEAIQHYRRALELQPMHVQASINLGDATQSQGKWEEALNEYRKVASAPLSSLAGQLEPSNAEHLIKDATGRMCELVRVTDGWYHADKCLTEALERWPGEAVFHNDRGNLLVNAGQFETALEEFRQASDMGLLQAKLNVAETLEALGETEESIALYDEILGKKIIDQFHPRTRIMVTRATVLPRVLPSTQYEINAHRKRFEREVNALMDNFDSLEPTELDPNRIPLSTAITMTAHNRNNRDLKFSMGRLYTQLLCQRPIMHEKYVSSYAIVPLPYQQLSGENADIPQVGAQRLRVGFVSRFMFNSAVGLYMSELLPQLDRNKYEIIVFAIGQSKSMKVVKKVEAISDTIVALPKDIKMVRREINAWKLDVLIYPELGMDKTTYFVSLERLAPVQAAWWGNADTSGVPAMDYYLASEHEHKNFRSHYSEFVHQFKGMGIYHKLPDPPTQDINRNQVRRAIEERFDIPPDFRFYLAIESIIHIHPDFDKAMSELLTQDPKARIFLMSTSNRKVWKNQLQARLEATGVPSSRLHFLNDADQKQESMLMRAADSVVASLHLTRPRAALQAFAAGVPVVCFPNELWASRITYGFYMQMGIDDLVATSLDEYVALAIKLATDAEFYKEMVELIVSRRSRLSEDRQAVDEWEKFFDIARARIYPSGDDYAEYIDGEYIFDHFGLNIDY